MLAKTKLCLAYPRSVGPIPASRWQRPDPEVKHEGRAPLPTVWNSGTYLSSSPIFLFSPLFYLTVKIPIFARDPNSTLHPPEARTGVSGDNFPLASVLLHRDYRKLLRRAFFQPHRVFNRIEGSERYGLLRRPSLDTTTSVSWN